MKIIGIRAYLNGERSQETLRQQVTGFREAFDGWEIHVAVCGEYPYEHRTLPLIDELIHYSDEPEGLTKPWQLILEDASPDKIVLTDGDRQHIPKELAKAQRRFEENGYRAGIPRRQRRHLFFEETGMDRIAVEDAENQLLLHHYPGYDHPDPQPGAIHVLDGETIERLSFDGCGTMAVDLVLHDKLLKLTGKDVETVPVKTRRQSHTNVNLQLEKRKIEELEQHFGKTVREVTGGAKNVPEALA